MPELVEAINLHNTEQVVRLMEAKPPDTDVRGAAVLCIESGNDAMLQLLLDCGANPNLRLAGQDWSLLHVAAEHQNTAAMDLLLKCGADVSAVDASGCTPLHHAVDVEADTAHQAGKEPVPVLVRLLLIAGASPHVKDAEGKSPIDVAREYEYSAAMIEMGV